MKKAMMFFLCFCLLLCGAPQANAYTPGEPYQAELEDLIRNETRREYVEMMLDYYLRTDRQVQMALEKDLSAIFFFEGASDHMDHPDLMDISYYRVSAVCIVVRLDAHGEPYIAYFNDDCSTLPDRPLDYTAWYFDEVGDVGPATVCDGTYEVYSVRHGGNYEALHIRTDYSDTKVNAVYMKEDGYVKTRATEINIHTRTGNHVLEKAMWSAGCLLVGSGDWNQFAELMETTYYAAYRAFRLDRQVGSVTIDRTLLKDLMYDLYENEDAVDRILTASRQAQPETYFAGCQITEEYPEPKELCIRGKTSLMTLPCSNATDARSRTVRTVKRGHVLTATRVLGNSEGNFWYEIDDKGQTCYLFTGYAEESGWNNWITRFLAQ